MNSKHAFLLVAVAVVLAGCTTNGGTTQEKEEPKIIEIEGPECFVNDNPCSSIQLTKYDGPVEIEVTFNNYGDTPVDLTLGGASAREVMVSKCNNQLASITGFTATLRGTQTRTEMTGSDVPQEIRIEGGRSLDMEWRLDLVPGGGDISSLGYSCPMDFELGFTQTINTSRQIQLKKDETIPDVQSLDSRTSAKRPVRLRVEAPDRTVADGSQTIVMRGYFQNRGSGEITSIDDIRPQSGDITFNCGGGNLRMYGSGEREGQSYRRVCRVTPDADDRNQATSQIKWIGMSGTYNYELPLNSVTLDLVPVE